MSKFQVIIIFNYSYRLFIIIYYFYSEKNMIDEVSLTLFPNLASQNKFDSMLEEKKSYSIPIGQKYEFVGISVKNKGKSKYLETHPNNIIYRNIRIDGKYPIAIIVIITCTFTCHHTNESIEIFRETVSQNEFVSIKEPTIKYDKVTLESDSEYYFRLNETNFNFERVGNYQLSINVLNSKNISMIDKPKVLSFVVKATEVSNIRIVN